MSAATSHHATALAGARNLASSRSVRGAAIRATARVARSAPRGASLRVNAEGTTPPPLFRPAPPRPRDIRRVASAPPRVTARERASRGVCHRNRPGDLADPTPRRDRADPDPPRRGRGAPPRDRATTRTPRGDPRAITDATPRVRERPPRRPLARFRPPRRRRRRALPSARPRAGRLRHVSRLRRAFRFRRRRKRREDLDETVGVESSSNALAPTGRRVRRGRAIIRAPIILTDPPPLLPARWFRRFPPLPLLLRAQPPRRTSR